MERPGRPSRPTVTFHGPRRLPSWRARPDGITLVSADGIWQGAWVERASALPRRPADVQPAVGPIGADPPLRQPVLRPKGPRRPLDTSVRPSARAERRGVRLEMWLPEGRVRTRDWLPVHVRITNTGAHDITFACGGGYTRAETAALFPHVASAGRGMRRPSSGASCNASGRATWGSAGGEVTATTVRAASGSTSPWRRAASTSTTAGPSRATPSATSRSRRAGSPS